MTRIVYITDTHLGAANDVGYTQQPRRADQLPALLGLLDAWISRSAEAGAPVACVLHGGDMVDATSREAVRAAAATFTLSVPVYLALGNHDVTRPDALALWMDEAPGFFPTGALAFSIGGDGWALHVVPTQWGDVPYLWEDEQRPHLLPEHLARLEEALAEHPTATHLLCTHAPALGVPPEQTGMPGPYHAPPRAFADTLTRLIACFPQLKGVIGGHNHINVHGVARQAHLITGSAFVETPFEFKVIDVGPEGWAMQTVPLLPRVGFRADYDWDKTFVQGRSCDRAFDARCMGVGQLTRPSLRR